MIISETEINTKKAKVTLTNDNHILIKVFEDQELELSDVKEINSAKREIAAGKLNTVIFIPGKFGAITKAAREFSASEEACHNTIAKAIVTNSISGKLIANFFIKINKPLSPTKLFSSLTEAINWLNSMRMISEVC